MTFPIILAHGVCRFDRIWSDALNVDNNDDEARDNLHYFKGIRTMLMKRNFIAYHSNVSWAADVKETSPLSLHLTSSMEKQLKFLRSLTLKIVKKSIL